MVTWAMIRQWQETFTKRIMSALDLLAGLRQAGGSFRIRAAAVTKRSEVMKTVEAAAQPQRPVPDQFHGGAGRYGLPEIVPGAALHEMNPSPIQQFH